MNSFSDLLKNFQKNDKIFLNVLLMISESQTNNVELIGKDILLYYKNCSNIESVRCFLSVLCEKDENFLEYFSRYSKIFDNKNDKLTDLLNSYKNSKRINKEERINNKEERINNKEERINKEDDSLYEQNIKKVKIEDITNNKEDDSLYELLFDKVQCKLCGLRYKENDPDYEVHIEDHMRKTRALDEKVTLSREYFSTFEGWIKNLEKITLSLKIDKVEKVIYKGGTVYCKICGLKIETIWDEEEDEFILSDSVKLDEEEYCHKTCVI